MSLSLAVLWSIKLKPTQQCPVKTCCFYNPAGRWELRGAEDKQEGEWTMNPFKKKIQIIWSINKSLGPRRSPWQGGGVFTPPPPQEVAECQLSPSGA